MKAERKIRPETRMHYSEHGEVKHNLTFAEKKKDGKIERLVKTPERIYSNLHNRNTIKDVHDLKMKHIAKILYILTLKKKLLFCY